MESAQHAIPVTLQNVLSISTQRPTLIISGVSSPQLPQVSSWGSFDWQYLAPYEERDTFLSTDAGLAWNIIRRDAHQYELGDSGSILVIGNDETVTNHVRFIQSLWGTHPNRSFNPDTDPMPMRRTAEPETISDAASHQRLLDHRKDDPVRFSVLPRPSHPLTALA
ncbi:hypothetical protein BJ138DRAFT_1231965 [Hygrophoropsis aurantiaca]|uniref:Uncharacterized protein n=1 Tax=Hygrophoropsis aurantiaca TaxID=72124 RepID=A0ACB7ZVN8_9AGAM|nr:hypothetical protein BJ138DRAFT_1231965 [Hygrophoropsis aurantiaca]